MQKEELLRAKAIRSAKPVQIGLAVGNNGNIWNIKVAMGMDLFRTMYEPLGIAQSPRSEIFGDVQHGLFITLTPHGGRTFHKQSQQTMITWVTSKNVGATENAVAMANNVKAVLVEYEDNSLVVLTEPLPDQFLSSKQRANRGWKREPWAAALAAFKAAGVDLQLPGAAPGPFEAPTTTQVVPAISAVAPVVREEAKLNPPPPGISDLRELISMLNDQVQLMNTSGEEIMLRIEEGQVRAARKVVQIQDI